MHRKVSCESRHQWNWCQCLFCSFEMHRSPSIQIFIAFCLQGLFNLVLHTLSWVLKHFPSKQTKQKEWIDTLLTEFLFGSTAAGYALCIAAFSQWKTITAYHLFLCDTILFFLSTVTMHSFGLTFFRPQKPLNRTLSAYFLGYKMLLIAIRCVNIYRLSTVWEDMDGKCFITFFHGNGNTSERDDAVLWLYINLVWYLLGQLVPALVSRSGWSELWAPQNPKARLILIILFGHIPSAFFFFSNVQWTVTLMRANRRLIDGNEFEFGFGQVGALVTLCLSFGRALISYKGARCILWLGVSNSDRYVLEHHQREATAGDNGTTTFSNRSELVSSRLPPPATSSE